MGGPAFRRGLDRGTARDCDRFRVPYPPGLIADLADRAGADGTGTLRALACAAENPDAAVLRDAGFEATGSWRFPAVHDWTAGELAGFVLSTSVLSRAVLGSRTADFTRDLRRELHASAPARRFRQTLSFGYDLARRPGPVTRNSHANHRVP